MGNVMSALFNLVILTTKYLSRKDQLNIVGILLSDMSQKQAWEIGNKQSVLRGHNLGELTSPQCSVPTCQLMRSFSALRLESNAF